MWKILIQKLCVLAGVLVENITYLNIAHIENLPELISNGRSAIVFTFLPICNILLFSPSKEVVSKFCQIQASLLHLLAYSQTLSSLYLVQYNVLCMYP